MNKRDFLKLSGAITLGSMVLPITACGPSTGTDGSKEAGENGLGEFTLPDLPYDFDALAPHIDKRTMQIHHGKHHAGYVRKLNAALKESSRNFEASNLPELLAEIKPSDKGVRNNGGGHFNHSLFWKVMSPNGGGQPEGDIANAINSTFGSFEQFKEAFSEAAGSVFGSGWAWLCLDQGGGLKIISTSNQDNPLMENIVSNTGRPILGIDVWEHAYYLNYQNERGSYIDAFFEVINWSQVEENMKSFTE